MKQLLGTLAASVLAVFCATPASGFEFSGDFGHANDVANFSFAVAVDNTEINLTTISYVMGGFNPALYVWDANGDLIASNDDLDPVWDFLDANIVEFLNAGTYHLSLVASENRNVSTSFADGFTLDHAPFRPLTGGSFWSVTIDGASSASVVPEPSTALLLSLGLAGIWWQTRRRKTA